MGERIRTNEISVIVQGGVDKINTPLCIKSIRKHLPGAEVILSTWEGTNTDGLDYDYLILNNDPGGYKDKFTTTFTNNTLRQLISTKEGVNRANKRYILKIRSDLIFKSCNFLRYFDAYPFRNDIYKIFNHRIIVCSFFTKKYCSTPKLNQPLPFHVSDWFIFGEANDIRKLYNVPYPSEPLNSWYLSKNEYKGVKIDLLHCSHQYAPEQYIFYWVCKNEFPQIDFENYLDYDRENIMWSEKIIANNCIILDTTQFRFICGKKGTGKDKYKLWTKFPRIIPRTLKRGLYTHNVFLEDYRRYCGKKFEID